MAGIAAVIPVKQNFSILSHDVEGNKVMDIVYLKAVSDLLTGKDDHSAHLASRALERCSNLQWRPKIPGTLYSIIGWG